MEERKNKLNKTKQKDLNANTATISPTNTSSNLEEPNNKQDKSSTKEKLLKLSSTLDTFIKSNQNQQQKPQYQKTINTTNNNSITKSIQHKPQNLKTNNTTNNPPVTKNITHPLELHPNNSHNNITPNNNTLNIDTQLTPARISSRRSEIDSAMDP